MSKKIGFVGLSHLGFVYSLASAKKGFKVVAFDFDKKIITNLISNTPHIKEPRASKILNDYNKNILYTNDFNDLNKCGIVFFSYDTPTNKKLDSNFKYIRLRINKTITKLSKNISFIILSQVTPGFTQKINYPKDKLFYQVETLIFGKAFERALNPERIIIGSVNKKIPKNVANYFGKFSKNIIVTNYNSAELSKIAINLFLTASITTTNTINELSNKINADWTDLKKILQLDKRIGKYAYLKPGLGISGGNLERDNSNFINYSIKFDTNSDLIKSFLKNSKYQKLIFLELIKKKINNFKCPLIYGLAYKENTHSIKNSISINLISLLKEKMKIFYYDKNLIEFHTFKNNLKFYNFKSSLPKEVDCIFIFHKPSKNHIILLKKSDFLKNCFIFDPYGFLPSSQFKKYLNPKKYFTLYK